MSKEITSVQIQPGIQPEHIFHDGEKVKKEDRTPTLIQNKWGQCKFAPRCLALELEKKFEAVILVPAMDGYLDSFKKALGYWEGFAPTETIQINGQFVKPEQIGAVNIKALIESAEAEVAKSVKSGKAVVGVSEIPGQGDAEISPEFMQRLQGKKFPR